MIERPEVLSIGSLMRRPFAIGLSRFQRGLILGPFLWAFTGDAVSKIAILVTSLIAVHALEPVGFGLYLGLSATTVLAASLWDFGVSTVVTREVAADRLLPRQAIVQSAALRVRTSPIWLATFAVGSTILARDADISPATIISFAVASLVIATHTLTLSLLRARLRFKAASSSLAIGRWVTASLSLVALSGLGARDALFVLAFALLIGEVITLGASITALVVGPRAVARSEAGHRSSSRLSFRAAAPFAANSVLNLAFNRFDVVLLAALTSADQLARYAPASRIQDAFYLIPVALSTIALPLVSREWHRSGTRAIRALVAQLIVLGLALALPAAILVFVYAPEVISFVLGDDYSGAVLPTRILIWSLPFSAVTSVLLAALAGTNRATDTTRVFVVAFVVATAMHLSLDWWWGATGAAVSSLSRDPAALCAAAIYARRAGLIGRTRSATTVRAVTPEPHQVSRDG